MLTSLELTEKICISVKNLLGLDWINKDDEFRFQE